VSPLNFGAQGEWRRGSWLCSAPWLLNLGREAEERGAGAALLAVEESRRGGELGWHHRYWHG